MVSLLSQVHFKGTAMMGVNVNYSGWPLLKR